MRETATTAGSTADDFNHGIIEEFRATGGRVGGPLAGTPMLLLHHIGARSGVERVTPLAYTPHGGGRYVIVASSGGSPTHPGWYHNPKANPVVEVEVGCRSTPRCWPARAPWQPRGAALPAPAAFRRRRAPRGDFRMD